MSEGSIGYYLHEDPVYDLVSLQPAAKPKAVVTKPAAVPATVAKPASAPTTTSKPTSTAVKPKPAPTSAPVVASTTATTTTAAAATIAPKPTVVPVPAVVKSAPTMVSKPTPTPAPSIKPAPVVTKTAHTPMAAEFDDGFGMDLAPDPDDLPPSPPSVKSAPTSSSIPAADNSSQYSWLGMKKKAPVAKEPTTSDYKLYEDTFSKVRIFYLSCPFTCANLLTYYLLLLL